MSSASESEGEIIETEAEKATTALPSVHGTSVDRQSRSRRGSASKSPRASLERDYERYRSRSPYRHKSPRGEKRRRNDDYHDERPDPRRFRVYYEDRRQRTSYADLDRSYAVNAIPDYDDRDERDRYGEKGAPRSRSPERYGRKGDRRGRSQRIDHNARRDLQNSKTKMGRRQDMKGHPVSDHRSSFSDSRNSKRPAEVRREQGSASRSKDVRVSFADKHDVSDGNSNNAEEKADEVAEGAGLLDEASLIEIRRKRREAIKAKYRGQATPLLMQTLQFGDDSAPGTPGDDVRDDGAQRSASPPGSSSNTPQQGSGPNSPTELTIKNDFELANRVDSGGAADVDEPSAADYDPTYDMREDQARNDQRHHIGEVSATAYDETDTDKQDILVPQGDLGSDVVKKSKDDFDMFADDDDDMFAPENLTEKNATHGALHAVPVSQAKELDMSLLDNWDDPEGYYRIILGELLDGRYHVRTNLGKGMFSAVVRALDNTTGRMVAVKIIRNNDTMRKAGMKEIEILQKLAQADPEDKKHLIRLERHFEHKGHLCMVFENLSINLREVLKKFGRDVGINLRAVRSYAQQMFLGLSLMRKCNILHADLKPDNVLVNESRNLLKICDLGSASDASDSEITPYLVSRFYRAPEIILGMPYDFAIDTWSVGCTLFELYTGKILFTGRTNNQMLKSIMECRGKFSLKMLKKAEYAGAHFDDNLHFRSMEKDKLTGKDVIRMINFVKPTRDLKSRLLPTSKGLGDVEMRELNLFADLLDRCLNLNPEKRCTPTEALRHPFINRTKP